MPYGKDPPVESGYGKDPIVRGGYSQLRAPSAPKEEEYAVLPEGGILPGISQEEFMKGQQEAAKGLVSGVAQQATGIGELVPGTIGEKSAEATQYLRGVGSPEMQTVGQFLPIPGAGAASLTARVLGPARSVFGGVGKGLVSGGAGGFIQGLLSPTGEADIGERYSEKAKSGLIGAAFGGPLGATVGGFAGRRASLPADRIVGQWAAEFKGSPIAAEVQQLGGNSAAINSRVQELEREIERLTKTGGDVAQKRIDVLNANLNTALEERQRIANLQAEAFKREGTQRGNQAAKQIMDAAESEISQAKERIGKIRLSAEKRQQQAQAGIQNIGQEKTLTQTGDEVRDSIAKNKKAVLDERDRVDSELRAVQDSIVSNKQGVGLSIDQTFGFRNLQEDLKRIFDKATRPDIGLMGDPGRRKALERVRDTIFPRRVDLTAEEAARAQAAGNIVQTELAPDGTAKYFRIIRPSLMDVDDARRFFGQVFKGKPPEGYETISGTEAKKMYERLEKIEEDYIGGIRRDLQENWRNASRKKEEFEKRYGSAILDEDPIDRAVIPARTFATYDSVQQAINLSNNENAIRSAAGSYFREILSGKSASEVKSFLTDPKNKDVLSHPALSQVRDAISQYAQKLSRFEQAQKVAERKPLIRGERISPVEAQQAAQAEAEKARAAQISEAQARAETTLSEQEKTAQQARRAVQQRATQISKEEKERIKPLIDEARKQLKTAVRTSPALAEKHKGLMELAELVQKREEQAKKSGVAEQVFNMETFINNYKNFLKEAQRSGLISNQALSVESDKLNRIIASQEREVAAKLLRQELMLLTGQIVKGKPLKALGTTSRILGGL